MTTSNEEVHIKPIIVSQNYHQELTTSSVGLGSSSLDNSYNLPKSTSSSFKRVSFGNAKGTVVETFIYESVPTIEEGSYYGPASASGWHGHNTREPVDNTPPSKVRVKSLESQTPSYIPPPSTVAGGSVTKLNNGGVATATGSGASSGVLIVEKRTVVVNQTSPLPSLQKMDEDAENPFRPDGRLSHEVEPIVECYKKRPFPVSTGSDYVDGLVNTSLESSSKSPPSSPPGKKAVISGSSSSPPKAQQQQSVPVVQASKNGGTREPVAKPQDITLTLTTADGKNTQLEIQHKQLTSPKAGHVEVVHIGEKRKKCGCCSIQ